MVENKVTVARSLARRFQVDKAMEIVEYFTASDDRRVSLVTSELDGRHGLRRNRRSAKLYFVLSGEVTIAVDGHAYDLRTHDALLVRPGELHAMEGRASNVLIVCAPAFDAADEVIED